MICERAKRRHQRVLRHPQFALALLALMALPHIGGSGQLRSGDDQADHPTRFTVSGGAVLMPKGIFLFVRKGKSIGAVRFTSIDPGSNVGLGKATYESYFQKDGSKTFSDRSAVKRSGLIDMRPLVGIGDLAFQLGPNRVDIGPWSFGCVNPGLLDMWPYRGEQRDYGYEFAPTSARNVSELNSSDKRLQWFRFDPDASVTLQASELPK